MPVATAEVDAASHPWASYRRAKGAASKSQHPRPAWERGALEAHERLKIGANYVRYINTDDTFHLLNYRCLDEILQKPKYTKCYVFF